MKKIVVNMARIGPSGSGMKIFAFQMIESLKDADIDFSVIASNALNVSGAKIEFFVPECVAITQKVSKLRPVLWYIYSHFVRLKNKKIICPTHHILPGNNDQVISVLDLRPYFFPDSFFQKFYFRSILPKKLKKIKGIITISNESKKLIANTYNFPEDRIYVVPLFIDLSKFKPATNSEKEKYILMVGATWPHKNAHELIENSDLWSSEYTLKIISADGKYKEFLKLLCKQKGIEDKVVFVGRVDMSALCELYQNAAAIVYPSKMEGFGMPPLEAMASGTIAIVSDIPVFKEIYGSSPIYVKLGNKESWANAFKQLSDVDFVKEKVANGLHFVQSFSKTKTGIALREAIKQLL